MLELRVGDFPLYLLKRGWRNAAKFLDGQSSFKRAYGAFPSRCGQVAFGRIVVFDFQQT